MKFEHNLRYDYQSKQFGISIKTFVGYEKGMSGEKKQLFALVVGSYGKGFIDASASGIMLNRSGEEYLTVDSIDEFFGFRKENIHRWRSGKRINLLKCLLNTPVHFVYHMRAHRDMVRASNAIVNRGGSISYLPGRTISMLNT
ncbi:MAG: hypothetical protein ABXS91_08780 [Sulfurimonas sp.]